MSKDKKLPAMEKPVAGKTDLKKENNGKQKNKELKNAEKVVSDVKKEREKVEKRSLEIQKKRRKQQKKEKQSEKRKNTAESMKRIFDNAVKKAKSEFKRLRYYFSKDFLSSLNYFRIITCLVLPFCLLIAGVAAFFNSTVVKVPAETRHFSYEGRIVDENACFSVNRTDLFRRVQMYNLKKVKLRGTECYLNASLTSGDDFICEDLYFENPSQNKCDLILTLIDEDGNIIYRSLGVKPGTELRSIPLYDGVSYGNHKITAAVNAYDSVTMKKKAVGFTEVSMKIGN